MREVTVELIRNVAAKVVVENDTVNVLDKFDNPLSSSNYLLTTSGEGELKVTVITFHGAVLEDPKK